MSPTSSRPGSGGEVAAHQVRDRTSVRGDRGARPPPAWACGDQAQLGRDQPRGLQVDVLARTGQGGVDAPVPVGLVRVLEQVRDHDREFGPPGRGRRGGAVLHS